MENLTPAARRLLAIPNAIQQITPNVMMNPHNLPLSICKYDERIIQLVNRGPVDNVCSNVECIQLFTSSCKKILPCSHSCNGTDDGECIPCLKKSCYQYIDIYNQSEVSQCPICLEPLGKYPLVYLSCKHFIHNKCIERRIAMKWSGRGISFGYLHCVICNKQITFSSSQRMNGKIQTELLLLHSVEELALKYFDREHLETDENYILQGKPNPTEYAMSIFKFYMCQTCKSPFFAGYKECIEDFEDEMLFCSNCFDYSTIQGKTNCEIHGREHIQYKCRFCCNLSSHFCFGTTHFCEDCHLRQLKGDYMTRKAAEELPKCGGIDACPLKGDHPVNGEEYAVCCLLCLD